MTQECQQWGLSSFKPNIKCYGVFRKEKSRKASKAYRDGLDGQEYQNKALIKELKTL